MMSNAGRIKRDFYGWLGYRVLRLPGICRSSRLFGTALWLLLQPWSIGRQRAWMYVMRLPDDLRSEFMDMDMKNRGRFFDAIAEELEEAKAEIPTAA